MPLKAGPKDQEEENLPLQTYKIFSTLWREPSNLCSLQGWGGGGVVFVFYFNIMFSLSSLVDRDPQLETLCKEVGSSLPFDQ